MRELDSNTVESSELVDQTFKFWLTDNGHIRSPFPSYIHSGLKTQSTQRFFEWASGLDPAAKDELSDEGVGEKFEEFIFETALTLIKTDDEKITILYPFLPRLGDNLNDDDKNASTIIHRETEKKGDTTYMNVTCENDVTKENWNTSFELPL